MAENKRIHSENREESLQNPNRSTDNRSAGVGSRNEDRRRDDGAKQDRADTETDQPTETPVEGP